MKVYLVKKLCVSVNLWGRGETYIDFNLAPFDDLDKLQKLFCDWLQAALLKRRNNSGESLRCNLFTAYQEGPHQNLNALGTGLGLRGTLVGSLEKLVGDQATVTITMDKYPQSQVAGWSIRTKEMKITGDSSWGECQDSNPSYSGAARIVADANMGRNPKVTVEITVALTVPDEAIGIPIVPHVDVMKKLLTNELHYDLEIIAANGASVKCHSHVMEAMFRTKMQESTFNRIEMTDISEGGVKAFLAFLYYGGVKEPREDTSIAFELLKAGHKYLIQSLECQMYQMLLGKPNESFSITTAVQLFQFARSLEEEGIDLKMKAAQVLKTKPLLYDSPDLMELFKTAPADAADLFRCQAQM